MSLSIKCVVGDVLTEPVDVLILKFAGSPHGADIAVAQTLGQSLEVSSGDYKFFQSDGKLGARYVLVLGVGPLRSFDYKDIEAFSARALEIISKNRPSTKRIGITIHGPGYGLDELAAIDSLVKGLKRPTSLNADVSIIERDARRAKRCQDFLAAVDGAAANTDGTDFSPKSATSISRGGTYSKRLFASLPFKSAFLDHWEYAIQPATHEAELVIERLDHEHFTGDIVTEIRDRIARCSAVVALLDENNPNVHLEVGYAWGVGKPTILAMKADAEPAFDVRTQRIIRYDRIGQLKQLLNGELRGLASKGIF